MTALALSAVSSRRPGRPTLTDVQLLDIALDLFLAGGYERTSIDAIAAAAGMAKRTVYARYCDKEALFKAALTRAIEDWLVPTEALRAAETDALDETLLGIARMLVANILSPSGLRLLRLTNAVSMSMPEIAASNTLMGTKPTLDYLADLFRRRLFPAGDPAIDIEEAALAFLHLIVGGPASTAGWGVVFDDAMIDRHTRFRVRLFLQGVIPAIGRTTDDDKERRLKELISEAASLLGTE